MFAGRPLRAVRRPVAVLALAAGLLGLIPPARPAATGCAVHHAAVKATDEPQGHDPAHHVAAASRMAGVASLGPGTAACDHCPANACALVAHCTGGAVALPVVGAGAAAHTDAGRANARAWQPAHTTTIQPPTPPPHALL